MILSNMSVTGKFEIPEKEFKYVLHTVLNTRIIKYTISQDIYEDDRITVNWRCGKYKSTFSLNNSHLKDILNNDFKQFNEILMSDFMLEMSFNGIFSKRSYQMTQDMELTRSYSMLLNIRHKVNQQIE